MLMSRATNSKQVAESIGDKFLLSEISWDYFADIGNDQGKGKKRYHPKEKDLFPGTPLKASSL